MRLDGGDGDRLVDRVDGVQAAAVVDRQPVRRREQVDAPGGGGADLDAGAGAGARDAFGARVLVQIAVLQPRGDDAVDPGGLEGGDVGGVEALALAEMAVPDLLAVRQDRALGLGGRDVAEDHAPAAAGARFSSGGAPCSTCVICAIVATAISAGERPPSGRPSGPWIRCIRASS